MTLGWVYLLIAGAFEVAFTTAMRFTGQGKLWAEIVFIACIIASFACLTLATRSVPIGVAYAVWTGIGAAGTLALSLLVFREPINLRQMAFLALLIISVIGIKLSATKAQDI